LGAAGTNGRLRPTKHCAHGLPAGILNRTCDGAFHRFRNRFAAKACFIKKAEIHLLSAKKML
jgi:hypothetical protein